MLFKVWVGRAVMCECGQKPCRRASKCAGKDGESGDSPQRSRRHLLVDMTRGTMGRRELDAFVRKAYNVTATESSKAQDGMLSVLRAKEEASTHEFAVSCLSCSDLITQHAPDPAGAVAQCLASSDVCLPCNGCLWGSCAQLCWYTHLLEVAHMTQIVNTQLRPGIDLPISQRRRRTLP
jgi:hypothetical protein